MLDVIKMCNINQINENLLGQPMQGDCKTRNETETKRNETQQKRNKIKQKRNETKRNEIQQKRNETKKIINK